MSKTWTFEGTVDTYGGAGSWALNGPSSKCELMDGYGQACNYTFTPSKGWNPAAKASGIGSTNATQDQNVKKINDMNGSLGGGSIAGNTQGQ